MKRRKLVHNSKKKSTLIGGLIAVPILLTLLGLFFIFEASSVTAFRDIGNSFYFMELQLKWFIIGLGLMILFSIFSYKKLYYAALPALIVAIIFLVLVLIPGLGTHVGGARRWINIGTFRFQPTELAKVSVILYLSSWFLFKEKKRFLPFFLLLMLIVGLVMIQPDLGTTIIIFCLFIAIYYFSGENLNQLFMLLPAAIGGFLVLIATSEYRMKRVLAFLNPDIDPQGISYHIRQIYVSLSSGGLLGRGLSSSRQKYQFLPEAHTDSIFAIIAEEVGFLGSMFIIILYVFLMYLLYKVAIQSKDRFGMLLASSVFALLSTHVIINLGGMVGLFPLTGVPLPFISYGGSNLLVFFAFIGVVINIARSQKM